MVKIVTNGTATKSELPSNEEELTYLRKKVIEGLTDPVPVLK